MDVGTPATEQDAQVPRRPCGVVAATFATLVNVTSAIDNVNELFFCLLVVPSRHGGEVLVVWSTRWVQDAGLGGY